MNLPGAKFAHFETCLHRVPPNLVSFASRVIGIKQGEDEVSCSTPIKRQFRYFVKENQVRLDRRLGFLLRKKCPEDFQASHPPLR
jgi:hypothetical protein